MSVAELFSRVSARLDARLMQDATAPLALGLSGGGDSVALLHLVSDWARLRGRRVVALTVDHRLNVQSQDWTAFAGETARACGADWQALVWNQAKGGAGVTARARAARHSLLAQAARSAGARVLLLAHSLDDVAETEAMRADGSTLGQLREWSPSPVWPQGRDVMLFRPLLAERREALRDVLRARGRAWIEDPSNTDMTYGRSRARAGLAGSMPALAPSPEGAVAPMELGPMIWAGVYQLDRTISRRSLAYGLVCAGGADRLPRGTKVVSLTERLRAGEDFTATLVGARLEAKGDQVLLMREAGEFVRGALEPVVLEPDRTVVWDGRFEITVDRAGWRLRPSEACLRRLEPAARRRISSLPPSARSSLPILENITTNQLVMAHEGGCVRVLGPQRLALSLGEKTQEGDLFASVHGAMAVTDLFSDKDCDRRASALAERPRTE